MLDYRSLSRHDRRAAKKLAKELLAYRYPRRKSQMDPAQYVGR